MTPTARWTSVQSCSRPSSTRCRFRRWRRRPPATIGHAATYDIEIREVTQQLHRDLPPTRVWGYDGSYPGPTIVALRDEPVTVNWVNDLRDSHRGAAHDALPARSTCACMDPTP